MPQLASTQRVCGAKNGCSSRNGTSAQGSRVSPRCWPSTSLSGIVPAKHGDQQPVGGVFGHALESDAGAAGHLDVDDRLGRAEADAADFDQIGVEIELRQERLDRGDGRLGAGAQAAGAGADEDRRAAQRGRAARPPRKDFRVVMW